MSYSILIKKSDGGFQEEPTNCNGSDATIVAARQCTIPNSVLSAVPFSLAGTDSVYATI